MESKYCKSFVFDVNKVFCFVGEINGVKYLKIDKRNKKLENSIKCNIKKINHECKLFSECKGFPECEEFGKIKVNYDDDFDKLNLLIMIIYL